MTGLCDVVILSAAKDAYYRIIQIPRPERG